MPAGQLAQTIASHGLSCTQLAPSKAIAGLKSELGQLNSDMARRIGRAFQDNGVQIAVIGCYVNPIHPDHPTRRRLLDLFKEHLQYARDLSCGLVALESGSVRADYGPDPRNGGEEAFQESLASIAELVEEAERWGITVGLEAVSSHVVSTPGRMQRMLQSVASNNLQVVFDPVNLLSEDNWREQERVIGARKHQLTALDREVF
jgi:sugar phosphate isomerase/epimerase